MSKHRRPAHGSRRTGLAAAALGVAALTTLGASAPAMAAKGGGGKPSGGSTSTSATLELVSVGSTDGVVNYGDTVTFNVATTATAKPMVKVDCTQAGTAVYWASSGFYDGYPWPWTQNFELYSTYWTGGAADCVAALYYMGSNGKTITLKTLPFTVQA